MSTANNDDKKDDQPVEVQEVLDVPDEGGNAPAAPSEQPPLPDFNS